MASPTGGVKAFSIEGRLYRERERLSFRPMTEEERLWRKKWVKDQILSECEPVEVPELYESRTNIFKRIARKPLDVLLYNRLKNVMKPSSALIVRNIVGKTLMLIGSVYAITYNLMYNRNDWCRSGGMRVQWSKPACMPGETCENKVKYDPSQEESYDLIQTSSQQWSGNICTSPDKPESNENEHVAGDSPPKEPSDGIYQDIVTDDSPRCVDEVVQNKDDNAESNQIDTNVYTSCPTVEPAQVEQPNQPPKIKDRGPSYRSLGSYYASRGFENSPI